MATPEHETPLHELVALAKEQGLAIDFAVYGGEHLDVYEGGSRITGRDGDPMDSIRAGVRALRGRQKEPARACPRAGFDPMDPGENWEG